MGLLATHDVIILDFDVIILDTSHNPTKVFVKGSIRQNSMFLCPSSDNKTEEYKVENSSFCWGNSRRGNGTVVTRRR